MVPVMDRTALKNFAEFCSPKKMPPSSWHHLGLFSNHKRFVCSLSLRLFSHRTLRISDHFEVCVFVFQVCLWVCVSVPWLSVCFLTWLVSWVIIVLWEGMLSCFRLFSFLSFAGEKDRKKICKCQEKFPVRFSRKSISSWERRSRAPRENDTLHLWAFSVAAML